VSFHIGATTKIEGPALRDFWFIGSGKDNGFAVKLSTVPEPTYSLRPL
jgi:hypothetical protein